MKPTIRMRRAVARMPSEHGLREGRAGKLRLDYNENTVGCSPAVRAALARITREQVAMYPEYGVARARLARFFGIRPDELALANGADEALRLLFDVFIERGDSILLVEPTFAMYRMYAGLFDARAVNLRYDAQMRFPLDRVLAALRRGPRAFFLANPNNPTGTLLGTRELGQILRAAKRTLVVMDEAYFEFCGVTVLPWIRRYPNLVVVRTFSKACGMAGLRLGCLIANREIAAAFRKAQPPFPVNTPALVAAEAAVRDGRFTRQYVAEVLRSRRLLEAVLERRKIPFAPSAANFLLADFGARAPALLRALERRGILLRDRTPDFDRPGWVRVTVGTHLQTRRLINALEELL